MIPLFDYMKLIFSRDEKKWNELSDMDKSRNFFMMNRFLSIRYPVQVHALSLLRTNPSAASDYWHRTMSTLHDTTPTWIYAKTKKKDEKEKKLELPSDSMIRWWCEKNESSKEDFIQNVNFFGETFIKEIRSLEKILKSQGVLT